jgi:hypothetical protein
MIRWRVIGAKVHREIYGANAIEWDLSANKVASFPVMRTILGGTC